MFFINHRKIQPKGRNRAIDEWKEIMNSFGLGEFMNNDLAVGAKRKIPSGEFYTKRLGEKWHPYQSAIFNGMGQGDGYLLLRFKWQIYLPAICRSEVGILHHIL